MRGAGARRVIRLPVSGAFHSPLMAGVADALREAFEAEAWADARVPVVSNVTAEPNTDAGRIRALLAEQVRSPVERVRTVARMHDSGVDTMIELGSGAALVGMVRRIAPGVRASAVHDPATLVGAAELLGSRVEATAS
jgi:[acyl-carrier-protein] S-malonyltransferase